tara:strand:+ start:3054 stop:3263 length:210 start_codon:yes stop_codon:yes gene_type:complete
MKWKNLEQEAKNFRKLRIVKPTRKLKPLTTRRYLAGQALAGLIARGKNNKVDVVKEAYEWADCMLDEED